MALVVKVTSWFRIEQVAVMLICVLRLQPVAAECLLVRCTNTFQVTGCGARQVTGTCCIMCGRAGINARGSCETQLLLKRGRRFDYDPLGDLLIL